jgi:molecular chaperone GrpE (heat shock protein)
VTGTGEGEQMTADADTFDEQTRGSGERTDGRAPDEAKDSSLLVAVLQRIGEIQDEVEEFHRRAAHRERVIDRLHEENLEYRRGLRRIVLEPVVADLIRLHDALMNEADRSASEDGSKDHSVLLSSFADEVELILDRCGIECYRAQLGEAFSPREHRAVSVVSTDDPQRHHTVAEAVAAGFRDLETGKVRRPARARFHSYQPTQPAQPTQQPGEDE